MSKVLVVAAHPDDEVLGCGGTIAKHTLNGDEVWIMIMAEGITSRDNNCDAIERKSQLNELHSNSWRVAKILGAKNLIMCDFPDNRMDSIDLLDVVKKIEEIVTEFKPDIVYTHHIGDVNVDHIITNKAVITACRPFPRQSVQKILLFETLSSTEWQTPTVENMFMPNWFVNIAETFDKKMTALKCYDSEMRQYPHPRSYKSVDILSKYRGMMVGYEAIEAFYLVRYIDSKS